MNIFDILTLIGGLSLFLFGMSIMGQALERRAGGNLRQLLGRLTTNRAAGLLTGLGITAVIQSSSATTVMVVGFVNSGLMTLKQAINVIMGANIGTTVTAWVLSLAGIDSGSVVVSLLKPSSFTPVLAMIGIVFYMFCRNDRKKDTGMVLLGFATLMFGMESMSGAVSGLREVPAFRNLYLNDNAGPRLLDFYKDITKSFPVSSSNHSIICSAKMVRISRLGIAIWQNPPAASPRRVK